MMSKQNLILSLIITPTFLHLCPEIRPIGKGEVGDRFLPNIMTRMTADDIKNECRSEKLCYGIQGCN